MRVLKNRKILIWLVAVLAGAGALVYAALPAQNSGQAPYRPPSYGVYTPAHPSWTTALADFINRRPAHPAQPIAYTHKVHLAKGLQCESCHVGVDSGPDAVIPNVKFCMTCHLVIATDRPEIKKIAAYQARGEDIPWARVYDYSESAHVKFNHAPHIRAECGLRNLPWRYDQADHRRNAS